MFFLLNIYPGLDFFYMIFWYFFLLLLWSIIWHQLFLLLATFDFGPMEKTATCVTPRIRDFGHWFQKIGRDAHNLQPFNGLILKIKQKQWLFPIWAQLCDWLYMYCNCLLTRLWHQNLIFLIKLFLHMTKKSKQKLIYLESKKSF